MDRNALDWLFSTAPQALAALVGLIFAGVTFINGTIDKEIDQDNTREDIYNEMKRNIHLFLKLLLWCAGTSIFSDLLILLCNPKESAYEFSIGGEFDFYLLIVGLVLVLNLFTLCFSLWFIIRVANPNYFEKTAKRLSRKVAKAANNGVEIKEFIIDFIKFEKVLRELYPKRNKSGEAITVHVLLRRLEIRELLTREDIRNLNEIIRMRNLIIHGAEDIKYIEKRIHENLKYYTTKISDLKNQLK